MYKRQDQARLLLTEWEQQKAELNTDKDTLLRKLTQGIDTGLYGDKEHAHSGPFQQDMVAYIMAKGSLTTVSYTHLDVYKRQAITLPPRKKPESDVRAMIAKASVITKQ